MAGHLFPGINEKYKKNIIFGKELLEVVNQ